MQDFKTFILSFIGTDPKQRKANANEGGPADQGDDEEEGEEGEKKKKKKTATATTATATTATATTPKKRERNIGGGSFSQVYGLVALPKSAFDKVLQIANGDFKKQAKAAPVSHRMFLFSNVVSDYLIHLFVLGLMHYTDCCIVI